MIWRSLTLQSGFKTGSTFLLEFCPSHSMMTLPTKLTSLLFHNCPYWRLNSNELSDGASRSCSPVHQHVALLERKCLAAFLGHSFAYVRRIIRFILMFFCENLPCLCKYVIRKLNTESFYCILTSLPISLHQKRKYVSLKSVHG